jgi:xylulokinase
VDGQVSATNGPTVLGVDLGTSSVKVVVCGLDGAVVAQAGAEYGVRNDRPGWAESDPEEWWGAVRTAVRAAVASAGADPVAIGLSGQMHGLVPAADDGRPVRDAILWADSRAVDQVKRYRELPDDVRRRLANPLGPGMAGPMLAWLAEHEPEAYGRMRWALQPKDWLRARLTGRFASEPSDASATLLFDVVAGTWDADVVGALGLRPEHLPQLLPSAGTAAGTLLPEAARELGLPAGLPVAAGGADTAVAALGSGLVDPGTAQLTIGTGLQVVTPVDAATAEGSSAFGGTAAAGSPVEPVTHLYRAATDSGFYAMAAVLNGGLVLNWVRGLFGLSWPEVYATAGRPVEEESPLFLPHLNGERTPYLDPTMRGSWLGLSPRHDREALVRAALEGVALAAREAVEALGDGGLPQLRLAGGGTTAPAWRQLLADVLQRELHAVEVPGASARGAAMLGARAAGLLGEDEVVAAMSPASVAVTVPDRGRAAFYSERLERFRALVALLRGRPADGPGAA